MSIHSQNELVSIEKRHKSNVSNISKIYRRKENPFHSFICTIHLTHSISTSLQEFHLRIDWLHQFHFYKFQKARIPTPDATPSNSTDKDNRFNIAPVDMMNENMTSLTSVASSQPMSVISTGVALIPANLPVDPNQNATPVTLFLSPIKESDSNSAHSTLQGGTATNALADWRNST